MCLENLQSPFNQHPERRINILDFKVRERERERERHRERVREKEIEREREIERKRERKRRSVALSMKGVICCISITFRFISRISKAIALVIITLTVEFAGTINIECDIFQIPIRVLFNIV